LVLICRTNECCHAEPEAAPSSTTFLLTTTVLFGQPHPR
jgi:hypothetical protein